MLIVYLIIILLVVFGGLALLLRHFLTSNVNAQSGHIQAMIQDSEQKLEEANQRREEAERYHQEVVLKAREEAEKTRVQLIQEGRTAKEELMEGARQESEELVERARLAAEGLRQELQLKIDQGSIEKAHLLLEQLLSKNMAQETHEQWVDALISNGFEDLKRLNVSKDKNDVEVVSAFPLRLQDKSNLQEKLSEKLGRKVKLQETVNPKLILGVRLSIDSVVIDGSMLFKIRESLRRMKNERSAEDAAA